MSPRTLEAYTREIHRFVENFKIFADIAPESASEQQIRAYITACCPHFVSSHSALGVHVAAIRYWFTNIRGRSFNGPLEIPSVVNPAPRALTRCELAMLFRHTRDHITGLMYRLMYAGGCGLEQVVRVRVSDLDFELGRISLRDGNDRLTGRACLFGGALKYNLWRCAQGRELSDYLFSIRLDQRGRPMRISKRIVQYHLTEAARELDLGPVTTLTLKSSSVVNLLRRGVHPRLIIQITGLRSMKAIRRYRKSVPKYGDDVIGPMGA